MATAAAASSLLHASRALAARQLRPSSSCLAARARPARRLAAAQHVACFSTSRVRLANEDEAEGSTSSIPDEYEDEDWAEDFLGNGSSVEAHGEAEPAAGSEESSRTLRTSAAAESIDKAAFFAEQEEVVVKKRSLRSASSIDVLPPTLLPLSDSSSAPKVDRLLAEADRMVDKAKRKRTPLRRVRTGSRGMSEAIPNDPNEPGPSQARKRFDAAKGALEKSFNAKQLRSLIKTAQVSMYRVKALNGVPSKQEMILALLLQRYDLEDPTEAELRQQREDEEAEALAAAAARGAQLQRPAPVPKLERELALPRAHVWLWVVHAGMRDLQKWARQADKDVEASIAQLDDGSVGVVTASVKEADAEEAREWILQWSSSITASVIKSDPDSTQRLSARFARTISDLSGAFVEARQAQDSDEAEIVIHALGDSHARERAAVLLRMHDVEARAASQRQLLVYAELSDAELGDTPPSLLDGLDDEGVADYVFVPSAPVEPTSWLSGLDGDALSYRLVREQTSWALTQPSASRQMLRAGVAETLDDAFSLLDAPTSLGGPWARSTRQYTAHFGHLLFGGHYASSSPSALPRAPLTSSWPITRALEALETAELLSPTFCPAVPPQGLALLEYLRKRDGGRARASPPPLGLGTLRHERPAELARFSYATQEGARLVVEMDVPTPGAQKQKEADLPLDSWGRDSKDPHYGNKNSTQTIQTELRSKEILAQIEREEKEEEMAEAKAEAAAAAAASAGAAEVVGDEAAASELTSSAASQEPASDPEPSSELSSTDEPELASSSAASLASVLEPEPEVALEEPEPEEDDSGLRAWWEVSGEADVLVPDAPVDVRISSSRILKLTEDELENVREQLTPFIESWRTHEAAIHERIERIKEAGSTPAKFTAPALVPLLTKPGPTAPSILAVHSPSSSSEEASPAHLQTTSRISRTTFTFGASAPRPAPDLEDIWASVLDDLDEGPTPDADESVGQSGFEAVLVLEESVRDGEEDMGTGMMLQWRPARAKQGEEREEKRLEWEMAVRHLNKLLNTPYKTLRGRAFSS